MKIINVLLFFIILSSCSAPLNKEISSKNNLSFYQKNYHYEDRAGTFKLSRQSGLDSEKRLVTKYRLSENNKVSEQSIVFSKVDTLAGKIPVLLPLSSSYKVWFDKKKYQSKLLLDYKSNTLKVITQSPEDKWNGITEYPIPKNNGVYCFYTQVIECAKRMGFLDKAIKAESGAMTFTLIWDGFPYMQEQYESLPKGPFVVAKLKFDGKNEQKEQRFSLSLPNHLIFYFVDEKKHFEKMFWPAQGVSVLKR